MDDSQSTNWKYVAKAPKETLKNNVGTVSWTASEYIDHQQGGLWFLGLVITTAVIAAILYFWIHDYFAIGATVIVGLTVGVFAKRTPQNLNYELSADGLKIENKQYPFSAFKAFSIIQEGPISSIELQPIKKFMPPISAFFETSQQDKIVAVLENFLPYEERQLDGIERLSRRLRF